MKKYMNLLGMMAVALMAASCSNDISDVQVPEQIAKDGTIHFTATLAPKTFDATTRALTESSDHTTLLSDWEGGEEICLYYPTPSNGSQYVKATVTLEEGVARISAELTGKPANDTKVTLYYPYESYRPDYLDIQDGQLSSNIDVREGTGTIKVEGSNATIEGKINLKAKFPIVRMDITEVVANQTLDVDNLAIFSVDGTRTSPIVTINFKEGASKNCAYFAFYTNVEKLKFVAKAGSDYYIALGTADLEAGKFYKTTVTMGKVGDVIGGDGKFYEDADSAEKAGTTAEAMIAWLNANLEARSPVYAIALEDYVTDGNELMSFRAASNAIATSSGAWNAKHKMPFGKWDFPNAVELLLMFPEPPTTLSNITEFPATKYVNTKNLRDNLINARRDVKEGDDIASNPDKVSEGAYWTQTLCGNNNQYVWTINFGKYYTEGSTTVGAFYSETNDADIPKHRVRYILTF